MFDTHPACCYIASKHRRDMYNPNKASIIIPTYKRPLLLRNLLNSLRTQTAMSRFEVIVANDAEDEDLSDLEAEFSDISVKVVNLRGRHGRPIARNQAARLAEGDILIFLDDDMTVVPEFVEAHLKAHVHDRIAAAGDILTIPEYANDPLARYIERQGARRHLGEASLPPRIFRTGNASVSHQFFLEAGMFDETVTTYGEDLDLGMRLSYLGAEFVFVERAKSFHHYSPDLDDMLAKLEEWGRYTLPIHAKRHPDLARHLWLDLAVLPDRSSAPFVRRLKHSLLWVALKPPFYKLARALFELKFLGSLLFPVIDYLRVYTYLRAYRSAVEQRQ